MGWAIGGAHRNVARLDRTLDAVDAAGPLCEVGTLLDERNRWSPT